MNTEPLSFFPFPVWAAGYLTNRESLSWIHSLNLLPQYFYCWNELIHISWFVAVKSWRFLHWTRNFLRSTVTVDLPWPFNFFFIESVYSTIVELIICESVLPEPVTDSTPWNWIPASHHCQKLRMQLGGDGQTCHFYQGEYEIIVKQRASAGEIRVALWAEKWPLQPARYVTKTQER